MAEAIKGLGNLYKDILPHDGIISPKETTPFGDFLDQAIKGLQQVSQTEWNADATIKSYAAGEANMDEALLAANKMSLEVQFAVKITDKFVTTFREIQQIQV